MPEVFSTLCEVFFDSRTLMKNPLHTLGTNFLNATMEASPSEDSALSRLTRRGFLMMTATLSSCAAAAAPRSQSAPQGVKTTANSGYRTPPVKGPVPRNPDQNFPSATYPSGSSISYSRVLVSGNYIAMTFDDGPHPQNTPRLLDMLRERNIKATFYVIGQSVNLYPGVVRRTVAEGHEIGNHSNTHRLLSKLSDEELKLDLSRCRDAVARAAGVIPRTLRPPYGGLLQRQRELVHAEFGYPTILWSVDPLDWKRPGSSVITSRILGGTTAGGIVLAHDLHAQTVDAMPATLDGLLSRGFKFVTVSQLIAMKKEAPAPASTAGSAPVPAAQ